MPHDITLDFVVEPAAVMRASALAGRETLRRVPSRSVLSGLLIALGVGAVLGLGMSMLRLGLEALVPAALAAIGAAAATIFAIRRNSVRILDVGFRSLEDPPRCRITLGPAGIRSRIGGHSSTFDWSAVGGAVDGPDGLVLTAGFYAILLPDAALPPGMDRQTLRQAIQHWAGGLDRETEDAGVF